MTTYAINESFREFQRHAAVLHNTRIVSLMWRTVNDFLTTLH